MGLLGVALALKVALLFTSQSMADGDEALGGVMAMHVLNRGAHAVYLYGQHYGAGVFVETHLAALVFGCFGVSDVGLKSVGLVLWCISLLLVAGIGRQFGGERAAWAGALLMAFAPQAAQWSLKLAGGYQVAMILSLVVVLLIECRKLTLLAMALAPLAAFAQPVVAPLMAAVALYGMAAARPPARLRHLAVLVTASAISAIVLWPSGDSVWDPGSQHFNPVNTALVLPSIAGSLFTPNLNSRSVPELPILLVAFIWMAALVWSVAWHTPLRRALVYVAAPLSAVLLIEPDHLVARHLLIVYPLSCLLIGAALSAGARYAGPLLAGLILLGGCVQIRETASPYVYGAGVQSAGVDRRQVRALVDALAQKGVGHVYCLDPMLQWNIIFLSQERVIARWVDPTDRFPEYPARVDRARLAGSPVALVGQPDPLAVGKPQSFTWTLDPDATLIERLFPRSPLVQEE